MIITDQKIYDGPFIHDRFAYNYFRDNKNSNIDTSDTRSLIYGRFIVARFIIDNNRYRFVEFEDVLPILNKY